MGNYTNETAIYICQEHCYNAGNDDSNPYTLTLYIADNGAIMLGASGNGCGNDIELVDIDGWSDADINEQFRHIDPYALSRNASELRVNGYVDEADYVTNWVNRDMVARDDTACRGGAIVVDLDMLGSEATEDDLARFVDALINEGYTWARSARDGEAGCSDGITEAEWQRIMDSTFNS